MGTCDPAQHNKPHSLQTARKAHLRLRNSRNANRWIPTKVTVQVLCLTVVFKRVQTELNQQVCFSLANYPAEQFIEILRIVEGRKAVIVRALRIGSHGICALNRNRRERAKNVIASMLLNPIENYGIVGVLVD